NTNGLTNLLKAQLSQVEKVFVAITILELVKLLPGNRLELVKMSLKEILCRD
ncbi:hypothetical protein Tco_0836277, partial [Tanacetum coccineum]